MSEDGVDRTTAQILTQAPGGSHQEERPLVCRANQRHQPLVPIATVSEPHCQQPVVVSEPIEFLGQLQGHLFRAATVAPTHQMKDAHGT